MLWHLITGDLSPIGPLTNKHAAAHRRLLVRYVERHVAEGRDLPALEFWREQS